MRNIIYILTLIATSAIGLLGCSESEASPEFKAGVFRLSKSPYNAIDGSKVTSPWVVNEHVGLLVEGQDDNVAANTINTTESALLFTFPVTTKQQSDNFCIYYPYNDETSLADGKIVQDLNAQSGELIQYAAAHFKGASTNLISSAPSMTLNPLYAILRISIPASSTANSNKLKKVEFKGNNGELVGGIASTDLETWNTAFSETSAQIEFSNAIELSEQTDVYMAVAPGLYDKGYTITVTDEQGKSNSNSYTSSIELAQGTITPATGKFSYTELAFVGSTHVYILNADTSEDDNLDILWHWDSSKSDIPDTFRGMFDHCDDAKQVDNGTKILVTSSSSTGGCALIDRDSQKSLFYARANNAHSAELLPNNRIIVACSTGSADRSNSICLFDIDEPDKLKYKADLTSAHGVQWIAARERLYAIGENNLVEYSLVDWNGEEPSLKVERIIKTPNSGLHDLTVLSDDELLCAGNSAFIVHLDDLTFTEIQQFHGESNVKSVNYNKGSGNIWATIAEESWWTFHIQQMNIGSDEPIKTLSIPFDKFETRVYKCRVYQW